jgi:tetratricopeptide (TPR) repeat protein
MTMRMFRSVSLFLLLLLCCNKISWANERLELLKSISSSGAPALTLKMLDQAQPKVDVDLYEWILWEQERYAILSKWKQWDELIVRIERLPDDLPIQFKNQVTTHRIKAYLELDQTVTARKILRQQLWQSTSGSNVDEQTWRRQIIISYIKDNRLADAQVAMLRFDQDFKIKTPEWLILRATVLIQTELYDPAIQLLKGLDSWQAKATYQLAQLKAEQITANDLRRLIVTKMKHPDTSDDELTTLAALRFFAAEQMSLVDRVVSLEELFQIGTHSSLALFKLSPDTLWRAYIEYAQLVGNRAEILIGDDAKWLELANNAVKVTPIKARSLFASIIVNSTDTILIRQAAEGYLNSFGEAAETKQNLLDQLFNRSKTFANAGKIPPNIRYQLVDLALKKADIDEATRLMSGLTSYPEGTSRFGWQLRQARVLILGGRYDEGSEIMQKLIGEYKETSTQNTDRILQVLFDMQTVGLHNQTINLFNQLLRASIDPRQHREILFWIADSYIGMKKYDQAALLYLQSAILPGAATMDPWAQTARFNAAESLQQSGLTEDARRIYDSLLKITQAPARRALLNRKIQQLWLKPTLQ